MHHLDEVAGPVGPDVGAARHTVDVRGNLLQQRTQRLVGLRRAARHDRRAVECALLTAGDTGADEVQAALGHRLLAADGVGVERVPAVDDDVALFEHVGQFVDHGVSRVAGLDHDQRAARLLQRRSEFRHGLGANELAFGAVLLQQGVSFGDRPVMQRDGIAVVREVAGDVAAHHGQPGDADLRGAGGVCCWRRHRLPFVFCCRARGFCPN